MIPGRDEPVPMELVRSRRRTLELRVYPDGRVQVRAPLRVPRQEISEFIESRRDWLARQLEQVSASPVVPPTYTHGEEHLLFGRRVPLLLEQAHRTRVTLTSSGLLVRSPSLAPDDVQSRLEQWYRAQGYRTFNELIDRHYPFFRQRGHSRPKLTIRKMKTRWGSLSSRGGMSLNLELVKAPVPLIEYVVIHELCHLEHANHGAGFQRLMTELLPDWRSHRRALNEAPMV